MLTRILALALLLGSSLPAMAQTYPNRPITMVVAFAAGGSCDNKIEVN